MNNVECLDLLIEDVKDELSVSCQIPIKLNTKQLVRIIKYAKKWFYKHYEDSVEEKFYFLPPDIWSTNEFKKNRTVILPNNIFSVYGLREVNNGSKYFNGVDADFNINKMLYQNSDTIGITSENLMNFVINESFVDMANHILLNKKLSYYYTRLNHTLRFSGELPKKAVVLTVYQTLSDCDLFTDEIFVRYVVAQAKIQISRVLGLFNYNLPGDIQINYDMIKEEGKDDLDNIKEELKGDEGVDWFMIDE